MTRIAAIDCGTNSVRLLVADVVNEQGRTRLVEVTRLMRIVRLGQGVDRTGRLAPEAVERTFTALREYKQIIDDLGAGPTRFVSTSAVRDAANREEFQAGVRDILGVEAEVIPGSEEAALSFAGAVSGIDAHWPRPLMVVDIGGGSTELVLGSDTVEQSISIDMGSVRVTEKFLAGGDPLTGITPEAEAAAVEWIDARLDEAEKSVDLSRVGTLVGVAGTVTTVTAQALGLDEYRPDLVDGAALTVDEVEAGVRFMVDQPIAVKAALGFMPPGREDVIAAGALIWSRIVARVVARVAKRGHCIDKVLTSEHDILDGIGWSLVARTGVLES